MDSTALGRRRAADPSPELVGVGSAVWLMGRTARRRLAAFVRLPAPGGTYSRAAAPSPSAPATAPSAHPDRPASGRGSPPPAASGSAGCAGARRGPRRPRPTGRAGRARPAARRPGRRGPVASCSYSGAQHAVREGPYRVVGEQRQHRPGGQLLVLDQHPAAPPGHRQRLFGLLVGGRRGDRSGRRGQADDQFVLVPGASRSRSAPPPAPPRTPARRDGAPPSAASTTSRSPSGTTSTASPARAAADSTTRRARRADRRRVGGRDEHGAYGPARGSRRSARPTRRRLGDDQPEGRVQQPAVQVPGDGARVVRLAREQHPQHRRPDPLLGRLEGAGPLGREGQQGDGRVDGVPLRRAQRRAPYRRPARRAAVVRCRGSAARRGRSRRRPDPPTTALAGAGRSRSRSTSAVSRAARRAAHSGAAATTAPEASYSAAQPSTCEASAASSPSGPLGQRLPASVPAGPRTRRSPPGTGRRRSPPRRPC